MQHMGLQAPRLGTGCCSHGGADGFNYISFKIQSNVFLHFFVEQKRLERRVSLMGNDENTNSANEGMLPDVIDSQQQQPPPPITDTDDIYPWCTLWFIGASTTQDQATAAVCNPDPGRRLPRLVV